MDLEDSVDMWDEGRGILVRPTISSLLAALLLLLLLLLDLLRQHRHNSANSRSFSFVLLSSDSSYLPLPPCTPHRQPRHHLDAPLPSSSRSRYLGGPSSRDCASTACRRRSVGLGDSRRSVVAANGMPLSFGSVLFLPLAAYS